MKKLLLILVALILALILPAGVVVAKTVANRIEFNLDGTYVIGDEEGEASVVLKSNLREKGTDMTDMYLSPLNGTITIGDEEYNISVKAEKQSESLTHIDNVAYDAYLLPDIVVNVKGLEGWKAMSGDLEWGTKIILGVTYSELEFWGTVDGEWVDFDLSGPLPTID